MKIIVCLKEVVDPALGLDSGLRNGAVFREGLPLRLNPNDAAALAVALGVAAPGNGDVEITLVSIGPDGVEGYLRNGLALGADRAVRLWQEGFGGISPYQKARLLGGVVSRGGADIVLTGAASLDTAHGQVGPLLAARLDWPCVSDVVSLEVDEHGLSLIRDIGRGEREALMCSLPAVVTVKGDGKLPGASLDRFVDSRYAEVT
ncbi:MAG TPA: hypothetical protein VJ377_03570, partial [Dehalococcoidales bacterium]|nr:hypothetical protein [Dehalococcoidales bacterium]